MSRHGSSLLARVLGLGVLGCALAGSSVFPARVLAQVSQNDEAQAYVNSHADIEDMVMVPMRDGVRLYHLVLFPKGSRGRTSPPSSSAPRT